MPVSRPKPRPSPSPGGCRRLLKWLVLLLLLLIGLPLLIFVVWNRIDEPQNAAASRFGAQWRDTVPDAENAWLMLAGLDAPVDADPIAWARARVDAFNARVANAPPFSKGLTPPELPANAVRAVKHETSRHGFDSYCDTREGDCLDWDAAHRDGLERLREDNALRLARYLQATALPRWRTGYVASTDTPLVDASIGTLHLHLLGAQLANPADAVANATALEALATELAFWQRLRSQPQDLFTLLLSARRIEQVYWLVAAWLERAPREAIVAQADVLDRLLVAPRSQIDWAAALGYEVQMFDRTMRNELPGPFVTLSHTVGGASSEATDGLGVLAQFAFLHQATVNLHADNYAQIERILEAAPADLAETERVAGLAIEKNFVQFEDVDVLLKQMSYNYTGRILASIAIPAFDWGKRLLDLESLRRMVQLARAARVADVAPDAMARFAAAQPEELQNPSTAAPYAWDAAQRSYWFAPLATKQWPSGRVALRAGARAAATAAAATPQVDESAEDEAESAKRIEPKPSSS
jgi:hypothetical protein